MNTRVKIFELCKDTKRPQYNPSFMNKIGGRSNAAFFKLDSLILTWSPILLPSFYFAREANGRAPPNRQKDIYKMS